MTILLLSLVVAAGSLVVLFAALEVSGSLDEHESSGLRDAEEWAAHNRRHPTVADAPSGAAYGARSKTSTSASLPRASATRRSPSSSKASPAASAWPLTSRAPRTTCT